MKKLTDFAGGGLTGGAPFFNEDFFDLQEETSILLKELFEQLVKAGSVLQSCVISGMAVTPNGGNWDVAPGIVYIETAAGRDFYRYLGDTNIVAGSKFLVPTADAIESRTYGDGASKAFFITKTAALGSNETGAIAFNPVNVGADLVYFSDLVGDLLPETGTFTPSVTFGGAAVGVVYSTQEGYYIATPLKGGGKKIDFNGEIVITDVGSSTGSFKIIGLPFNSVGNFDCLVTLTLVASSDSLDHADYRGRVLTGTTTLQVLRPDTLSNLGMVAAVDTTINQVGATIGLTIKITGWYVS
jgi:hypothetical protein